VRLDYQRQDPSLQRLAFWKSDAGGFVGMAIWVVGFIVATVLLKVLIAVFSTV
jgi:hypothetical protein